MVTGPIAWKIGLNEAQLRVGSWPVLRGLLLVLGTVGSICLGRFYGLIALSLVWTPYVFFNPREGLWISPSFILLASLVSPPEGFVTGVGYSPELAYWAIGIGVLFTAMLIPYLQAWVRAQDESHLRAWNLRKLMPPRGFRAFAGISVVAAAVGVAHGYSLQNVAKQFFGCALLCGYFLFVLRFAPRQEDMEQIINRIVYVAVMCSVIYTAMYFSLFSEQNFSKHLTSIVVYDGGLFVLLVPRILRDRARIRIDRTLIVALFLFAIPVLAQLKRVVGACLICGLLALGLRSISRRRRYLYAAASFLLLALALTTGLLNPIGTWFSKYADSDYLIPEDVQSNFSVVTRVAEFSQVMESLHGTPILGEGLGSTITWYDPFARVYWDQETTDNGLLYLLVKMGIVGTIAFLWFIYPLGATALRNRLTGIHLALFLLFIFHLLQMLADVTFFYFLTAGWVGTTCGFLYILNKNSEIAAATPA
ncbi:MAG: O-antigen ligase family protein [Terriglobales bacterium]